MTARRTWDGQFEGLETGVPRRALGVGAWELTRVRPEGNTEAKYGMRTPCTLGDHWLALSADGSVASTQEVTLYDTAEQAEAVRAAWERQQEAAIVG